MQHSILLCTSHLSARRPLLHHQISIRPRHTLASTPTRHHTWGEQTQQRAATIPLHVWYLGDSVLDVSMQESSPVPLAMPLIIPTMWFQNNEIDKGRKAEQRRHDEAVQLLYSGHPELASSMLAELRTSLQDRLQTVLYSEADCRFLRGEYQAALDILNHRQILAPCDDVPDYKVHWMAGLCLANLGRIPEAVLQLQLARQCVTCERAAGCITVLLVRLKDQLGMVDVSLDGGDDDDLPPLLGFEGRPF